jgi:hypothetical protein
MIDIGKLYYLAKEPGIVSYAMHSTWDGQDPTRKVTWVTAEQLSQPFLIVQEYQVKQKALNYASYWIKIVIGENIGWISIEKEQLRLYKPYRR